MEKDLTTKQAMILAVLRSQPGITGPDLYRAVAEFIPQIQYAQFLARLRNRGFCKQTKVKGEVFKTVTATEAGLEALNEFEGLVKFIARQTKRV